jgi:hypothetical protein
MFAIDGERVQLLRARDARHAVHREHRRLPPGERLHEIGVLGRPDEADQQLALVYQRDFLVARRADLEHDVGRLPQRSAIAHHFRTATRYASSLICAASPAPPRPRRENLA